MRRFMSCSLGAVITLSLAGAVQAASVDLTGGTGSSTRSTMRSFEFAEHQPTGTGVFKPFLQIANVADQPDGYNTSGDPIPSQFEVQSGGSSPHTHDLVFGNIGTVERGGTDYLLFLLDINEPGGAKGKLSLDTLQIYTSATGSLTPTNPADLGDLRYDLDDGEDSYILMDGNLSHGSGSSDMAFYIPLSKFSGVNDSDFLYLYTQFGQQAGYEAEYGGFEEFSADPASVPTPTAVSAGLLLLGGLMLRRRRQQC